MNELHLFAGAGGGILGGMLLGHTCVCAVEIEKYPRRVLLQRQRDGILPRFPIWDDIQTFDGRPWKGRVDVVCGGFPCQDISAAGKGAGIDGERSSMWRHMARIIGEILPRFVLVENSPMLVGRGLARVLGDLAEMGYDARWCVLGAADLGAPHKRDRIWLVATNVNGEQLWEQQKQVSGSCSETESRDHGTKRSVADANGQRELQSERAFEEVRRRLGDGCDEISNTESLRRDKRRLPKRESKEIAESCFSGEDVSDANGERLEELDAATKSNQTRQYTGAAAEAGGSAWWATEPRVGRVAHGVADRVDRLKAIGNGQVPAVAESAWRSLAEEP